MRTLVIPLLLIIATSSSLAAPEVPDVPSLGTYGFNWSKPKTAKCRKVTEAQLKQFKTCNRESPGFGGPKPTHACQSNEGEWIIYSTKSQCEDELGTMNANAP